MTYFAPRQGLFAVIILASLVFHVLFFVISQEYEQKERQHATAQKEALLIAEEIAIPLNALDRVSVSVIANRYLKDDAISFIGVYDSEDNLIVPVGKESPSSIASTETITLKNQVLGSVAVQTHDINRAQIITQNWVYLVSILVLHIFLWLIYGYVARPSKNMLTKIAEDMRLHLLSSELLPENSKTDDKSAPLFESDAEPADTQTDDADTPDVAESEPTLDGDDGISLDTSQGSNYFAVQIRFEDANGLMNTVSHHTKSAYFNLCNQLLARAINELLKLPVISGVELFNIDDYGENGATVILQATNRHAKAATAAVMLGKLITMLNQIVYDKHRELKRFGLPVRAMVSSIERKDDILVIAKKHQERVLVLVSENDFLQLNTYGTFDKLINPTTVSERECRWLKSVSMSTAERLENVRDAVLLSED